MFLISLLGLLFRARHLQFPANNAALVPAVGQTFGVNTRRSFARYGWGDWTQRFWLAAA